MDVSQRSREARDPHGGNKLLNPVKKGLMTWDLHAEVAINHSGSPRFMSKDFSNSILRIHGQILQYSGDLVEFSRFVEKIVSARLGAFFSVLRVGVIG